MLKQQTMTYHDDDNKLIGQFIYDEQNSAPQPGIVLFPAFEGIAEFAINYGKDLAKHGFAVLVADIYGDAKTTDTIEGCFELVTPFLKDRALVRRRAQLAFTTLADQQSVDNSRIGTMGFCFGGMCGLEIARSGANIKAVVAAHSAVAHAELENHNQCQHFLILNGYADQQVPPSHIADFAEEMKQHNVKDWDYHFFGHAKHSYTDPKTGTFNPEKEQEMGRAYNPVAAKRCFHYAVAFFKETLSS